jgi:hypothetical protein
MSAGRRCWRCSVADTYRVLVTGSRTFAKPPAIYQALNTIRFTITVPLVIVQGQCDPLDRFTRRRIPWERALRLPPDAGALLLGADWHASLWVRAAGAGNPDITGEAHPADWEGPCGPNCQPGHRRGGWDGKPSYCPAAGDYRNALMVDLGADECVAAPDPCSQVRCVRRSPHDSHGTASCIRLAERAAIPVRRVTSDD